MKVKLAGFNIDIDILKKLSKTNVLKNYSLTPETFSAAYARISRSSKDVSTLRKEACKDVEKARKSNQRIIFEMGHHSIAEHSVFNFDIMEVSRLALEEIEKFRLVSYTEKSQRYVKLDGDFVIPKEIKNPKMKKYFKEIVNLQNDFYQYCYEILLNYFAKENKEILSDASAMKIIEGRAKEDARYILPLATKGQVGITINGRNLEHLFRRFNLSNKLEVKELGNRLFNLVKEVAPSIILYPEPSEFEKEIYGNLENKFSNINLERKENENFNFKILNFTKDADEIILASLISRAKNIDFQQSFKFVQNSSKRKKENIYEEIFKNMKFYDVPPREFELADITFQAVISAAAFAQLKRHRMATLIANNYDINLGNTIPESIKLAGLENKFNDIIEKTNQAYEEIKKIYGKATAEYILTNSHRRQVLLKMNLREIYHFVRLRADKHAQWDIRNLAEIVREETKKIMPYASMLLCGKDQLN